MIRGTDNGAWVKECSAPANPAGAARFPGSRRLVGAGVCGGASSQGQSIPLTATAPQAPTPQATSPNLVEADVNIIVLQAINEANARGKPATIAVVDRVGNVLTVAQMVGAPTGLTVDSSRGIGTGLENRTAVMPGAIPA